jgi:peptidoglycan hydrolase-like protein with peptidoglycan-binding domain
MLQRLCKRSIFGLLLAVLAAGTLCVAAASAQSASSTAKKSTASSTSHSNTTAASSKSSKNSKSKRTKKVKGQAAPTPERISEIQDALAKKGMLAGPSTGKWDDSTVEAMKKFQSANGLNSSGKLDALTLQKLGFGSEVAGLGRPTPPPNSSNRLRNTSSQPADPSDQ